MLDTVIIGAGLAGITCARTLQAAGQEAVLLDKSRGVGGRLATRRLHGTHADHGFRVWAPQHPELQESTQELVAAEVLHEWGEGYAAKDGGNAIAKYLARDLKIYRQHRVIRLESEGKTWRVWSDAVEQPLETLNIVLAIPASQAADMLSKSGYEADKTTSIRNVEYAPCITVMAGYETPIAEWPDQEQIAPAIGSSAAAVKYLILDSSKRGQTAPTVVVIHSTAEYAVGTLSIDRNQLEPTANDLLQIAGALVPGIAQPDWFQVHRWRYAFVTQPCLEPFITLPAPTANPVLCCGDWCQPNAYQNLDAAYQSGQAAAAWLCNLP